MKFKSRSSFGRAAAICGSWTLLLSLLLVGQGVARSESTISGKSEEEIRLITVLQSTAGPGDKDDACARLKRIGSDRSVPALAALLTDEQLSHSARYALESMGTPAALKALVSALGRTSGSLRVGIVDSIGVGADQRAAPVLKNLLNDRDPAVAQAAAAALGRIGNAPSLKWLLAAMHKSVGEVHVAQVQASLACARAQIQAGHTNQAKAAFEMIYTNEPGAVIRQAAFRGVLYSSGRKSSDLILKALTGDPRPAQMAALQELHEYDFGVAEELSAILPDLSFQVQVSILDGLTQIKNRAAVDIARPSIASDNADVRLAAIRCLGALGDTAAIPLLEKPAAYGSGLEKQSARDALVRLHHGNITEGLVAQLRTADEPIKAQAARALGQRGDTNALPALFEAAVGQPDAVRSAALQAIGLLGEAEDVGAVVRLVVQAKSDNARIGATEALNDMLQRLLARNVEVDFTTLGHALKGSSPETRIALLDICGAFKTPQLREAVRECARDNDSQVRAAGIRSVCDTTDIELLPDLVSLATDKSNEKGRRLAISGCVRLLTQEDGVKVPDDGKVEPFKRILSTSPDAAEKRILLSGLSRIPTVESLRLADSLLQDSAVQPEAEQAIIKIAINIPAVDRQVAQNSINRMLALPIDEQTRKTATETLKNLQGK